jgi:alpha-beta hydrolase superfamily lysophospholipase
MTQRIEGSLESPDGNLLFTRSWALPAGLAARGIVVIVHGLGEHGDRYSDVAEALTTAGFSVAACDHRGHGRSSGLRGHIDDFSQYGQDLRLFVDQVRQGHDEGLPVFLLGQSMGGLIAVQFALQQADTGLAGLITINPCLDVAVQAPRLKVAAAKLLARVLPRLRLDNELKTEDLCRDQTVIDAYVADPLVHRQISTSWYMALLAAMADVAANQGKLSLPSHWVLGGNDRICAPMTSRTFAESSPSGTAQVAWFEESYHEPHNGPDKSQVLAGIIDWLGRQSAIAE